MTDARSALTATSAKCWRSCRELLFFPVENAHAADHPGCAHVGGDKIQCFFQISDVVDLGNAFLFQLFHKGIHVAVEAFLGEEILERKSSAAFYDAQCLPHDITLVSGGVDFMEDEVADGGVKRLVGIVQVCRIAFLKMDAGSDALDCRIFFALLFGVVPQRTVSGAAPQPMSRSVPCPSQLRWATRCA